VLTEGGAHLGPVALRFSGGLTPSVSPVPIEDARLKVLWGDRLYRLELTTLESAPGARLDFTFFPAP